MNRSYRFYRRDSTSDSVLFSRLTTQDPGDEIDVMDDLTGKELTSSLASAIPASPASEELLLAINPMEISADVATKESDYTKNRGKAIVKKPDTRFRLGDSSIDRYLHARTGSIVMQRQFLPAQVAQ